MMWALRRFGRARGGQAVVEFAIIAPFLMLPILLGSFDVLDMLQANKRAQNATASIADVVSRDTEVTTAEVRSLWDAVDVLMYPDATTNMNTRVTSVRVVNANSAVVVWSEVNSARMTALRAGAQVTLRAGMMQPGTSVIMTETEYPYSSPLGFLTSAMTLKHTAYRRSRLVDPIPRIYN